MPLLYRRIEPNFSNLRPFLVGIVIAAVLLLVLDFGMRHLKNVRKNKWIGECIAGGIGIVFVIISLIVAFWLVVFILQDTGLISGPQTKAAQALTAGDLTAAYGKKGESDRIKLLPKSDYVPIVNDLFATAQKSIEIVTINGSSWIEPEVSQRFRDAITRIPVTLLLLDYTDKDILSLFDEAMIEYNDGRWSPNQFADNLKKYEHCNEHGRE